MIESYILAQRQSLPLEAKVMRSEMKIREWYEHWQGNVAVSYSGGRDSTVLLDLVREIYPDVTSVFVDTGLEYPEVRDFVKNTDNIEWVKPSMNFAEVLRCHGYPVVSKRTARDISDLQNPTPNNARSRDLILNGVKKDGTPSAFRLPKKWRKLVSAPFKVSHKCCAVMKKNPLNAYKKRTGKHPYVGTMASDSRQRKLSYLKTGCNSFGSNAMSRPLACWLPADVLEYIETRKLPYSKIYDMGENHTGCMFCMFGAHMEKEPNRFQRMKTSHPKQWEYCMDKLGLQEVLDYIGIPSGSDVSEEFKLERTKK